MPAGRGGTAVMCQYVDTPGRCPTLKPFRGELPEGAESSLIRGTGCREKPFEPDPGHAGEGTGMFYMPTSSNSQRHPRCRPGDAAAPLLMGRPTWEEHAGSCAAASRRYARIIGPLFVVLTLIGWISVIAGIAGIVLRRQTVSLATTIYSGSAPMAAAGAVVLVLGLFLSFQFYRPAAK
jgi:hypothetical protein